MRCASVRWILALGLMACEPKAQGIGLAQGPERSVASFGHGQHRGAADSTTAQGGMDFSGDQGSAEPASMYFASAPPTGMTFVTGEEDGPWGIVEGRPRRYVRPTPPPPPEPPLTPYPEVVRKVANMVHDGATSQRVRQRGLALVNVTWEDTGRSLGSSGGPNISDFTLQVRRPTGRGSYDTNLMPVIRPPNFVDRTGDIALDKFFVRVGNERGAGLRTVRLADVLSNLQAFSSDPRSIVDTTNLLSSTDTHVLASAQAVFLPVPRSGKATFNPALFNYQSAPGFPAVLTLLVTRQGTSIRVIENRREECTGAGYGQELYFNESGHRAAFTAERKSDVKARIEAQGGPQNEDDRSALAAGADVLFMVQVPLMHARPRPVPVPVPMGGEAGPLGGAATMESDGIAPAAAADAPTAAAPKASMSSSAAPTSKMAERRGTRGGARIEAPDMEQAVVGHGPRLGPYQEGYGRRLVRDPKFPIRVTVQFYKATSNGVVSDADLDAIRQSIESVYQHADYVGSLVVPQGDPLRPTAWNQPHVQGYFPW